MGNIIGIIALSSPLILVGIIVWRIYEAGKRKGLVEARRQQWEGQDHDGP